MIPESRNARLLNRLSVLLLLAVLTTVTWAIRRSPGATVQATPILSHPLSIADDAILGTQSARLAMVEFSGFQCPFCAKFSRETLPLLKARYIDPGKLMLAFKHLPLDLIHPFGVLAAESAECARSEDRFWNVQDRFFAHPDRISATGVRSIAAEAGMDSAALELCLSAGKARTKVEADALLAYELGVTSTPTFLIGHAVGGQLVEVVSRLSGNRPFSDFDKVLTQLFESGSGLVVPKTASTK
jgi:protein-disulfide isomerase